MRNNEEQAEVNNPAVRKPQGNNIHVLSFKLIVAILGREGFLPPPSPLLQKKKTKAILLIEDFCVRIRLKHFVWAAVTTKNTRLLNGTDKT